MRFVAGLMSIITEFDDRRTANSSAEIRYEQRDPQLAEPIREALVGPTPLVDQSVPQHSVGHRPDHVSTFLFGYRALTGVRDLGRHHRHARESLPAHLFEH